MTEGEDETTVEEYEPSIYKKKTSRKIKKKSGKKKKQSASSAARKRNKNKKRIRSVVWALPRKPPMGPSYSPCPHIYFKHSVVNRSKLDQKKYDSLLARPKGEPWSEPPEEPKRFKRRQLTTRTVCLALPSKRKMAAQLEEFSGILTPRMTENLGNLLETDCDLTKSPLVIYPKGTNPETSGFLKDWAKWLFESFSKIYSVAGQLRQITGRTEQRLIRKRMKTRKPTDPKEIEVTIQAWKLLIEESKASMKHWRATKEDIIKTAKIWEELKQKKLIKRRCCGNT